MHPRDPYVAVFEKFNK